MKTNADADSGPPKESAGDEIGLWRRVSDFTRAHPHMIGFLFASVVAGSVAGVLLPLGDVSMTRRIVGGAVSGFYFGLFPLGFRLLM